MSIQEAIEVFCTVDFMLDPSFIQANEVIKSTLIENFGIIDDERLDRFLDIAELYIDTTKSELFNEYFQKMVN